MTNPPWSRLRDFTRHAMRIAPNVVWLAPLTNLTTKARLRDLDEAGFGIAELVLIDTPKDWPQSGPAPVLFRSRAHVRRPFVRRPLVISSRGLNVSGAGCRSR